MIALLRYQSAILLRSARWIFPLMLYVALVAVGFGGSEPLRDGLDWSAAMLVPVVALLTRSMLTAEPGAARSCVAAATGPARAQFATLLVALAGGATLALAGAGYEVLTDKAPGVLRPGPGLDAKLAVVGKYPQVVAAGLVTALVCLLVGSAVGALFNPPVLRRPAMALLSTMTAVVVSLAWSASPVSAAVRGSGAQTPAQHWPSGVPLLVAAVLLAVSWTASAVTAARRGGTW